MWVAIMTIKAGLSIPSSPGRLFKITSQRIELITAPSISKPANRENCPSQFRKSAHNFK